MVGEMRVHLFKVNRLNDDTVPLGSLLSEIHGDLLANRLRTVGFSQVRLENALPPNTPGNDSRFWLLDFVKLRFEHGPGKAGRTTAIEGFDLEDDQGFGEETAALYDPRSNYMIIQYNHHGVRASAIKDYLSAYNHEPDGTTAYDLQIKLDETAEIRLAQKNYITKVHFKIAPTQMTAAHRVNNIGLNQALQLNESYSGHDIELVISAQRGESLRTRVVEALVSGIKRLADTDQESNTAVVSKFEVSAKNELIDRADAINMLSPKLEQKIDQLMLGADRRYTLVSRWDGLARAARGWQRIMTV